MLSRRELMQAGALLVAGASIGQSGGTVSSATRDDAKYKSSSDILWYTAPATKWTEALPIGNGRMGGMVWGGAQQEKIDLNDDTLWSGEPYANLNPEGLKALPEIRKLLIEGKNKDAQRLVEQKMNGKYNQNYLAMGDLTIDQAGLDHTNDFTRALDLATGIASTTFSNGDAIYLREVFASHPAQAIVVRYATRSGGKISLKATLNCQLHFITKADGGALRLVGRAPQHADAEYHGKKIIYDDAPDGKGMRFEIRVSIQSDGGNVTVTDQEISAEGCDTVTLILVSATSYNGPHKSPSQEGRNPSELCDGYVRAIEGKTYQQLREEHIADHSKLFHRVQLEIGQYDNSVQPTNERVKAHSAGNDPAFAALYYQFARYLWIAGSRPGSQPLNLQGIWNDKIQPPWASNWTLNCNAEINYWGAEAANLGECHLPLVDLTRELSVDGAHIARDLYGVNGWMAHHNTDLWRQAGPVSGSALWSIFQVGGAWLCQHLFEHYAFTQDEAYLREIYPTLKGAAQFYLEDLMEEPSNRWLVTGPDTNFENNFKKPDGTTGCVCMGPTGSMQMVRELLNNCVKAAVILNVDKDFCAQCERTIERLPPMKISPTTGELQEWLEDWQRTAACQVLSSWGAICAAQITPRHTPELAGGLRKIFDDNSWWKKGNVGSWQGAFQSNLYARMGMGDIAISVINMHINKCTNPNLLAAFAGFCPFQIDGNMGIAAAIGEMILQSHAGEIELLPALPKAWPTGKVTGLRARGAFEVDIRWNDGKLVSASIKSLAGKPLKLRYGQQIRDIKLEKGQVYQWVL